VVAGTTFSGVALASPAFAQTSRTQPAQHHQALSHHVSLRKAGMPAESRREHKRHHGEECHKHHWRHHKEECECRGKRGPHGPEGPMGDTGPQGPNGPTGPASPDISTSFQGSTQLWAKAPGSGDTFIMDSRNPNVWVNISGIPNYPGDVSDVTTTVMGNTFHIVVLNPSNVAAETVCTVNPAPITAGNCTAFATLPARP
jgi:hypothetical protein